MRFSVNEPDALNPVRILAYSVTIILHGIAVGLLMLPAAAPKVTEKAETQVVFVQPPKVIPPPPPPPPPPPKPDPKPKQVIKERVLPQPQPKPQPKSLEKPRDQISIPDPPVVVTDPQPIDPPVVNKGPPVEEKPQPPKKPGGKVIDGVVVLKNPKPPYPPEALRAGVEGEVVLLVTVGPAGGNPTDVTVSKSSGDRDLDRAARAHVLRNWEFEGTGAVQKARLPISFTLG